MDVLLLIGILFLMCMMFVGGFGWGAWYERRKMEPIKETEEETPYKKVRRYVPKFNFGDQLDPIVPENTKRPGYVEKEVEYVRE